MEASLKELVLKYADLNQLFFYVSRIELNEKLGFPFPSFGAVAFYHEDHLLVIEFCPFMGGIIRPLNHKK